MTWLPGGLGDLVSRADGRPIYCTSSSRVRRQLAGPIVARFQRQHPDAQFVNARELYRGRREWLPRWSVDCSGYGAAVLITFGADCPGEIDPLAEVVEEHAIGMMAGAEARYFVSMGRPVAWYAVEFPDAYWVGRFVIEPFFMMSSARFARLRPDPNAKLFSPERVSPFHIADCDSGDDDFPAI